MGKHEKIKTITVYCQNGHKLWRYKKVGAGRLQKCYEDMIGRDYTENQTGNNTRLSIGEIIYCAECQPELAVATIKIINGRRAYEIIQKNVRTVRT